MASVSNEQTSGLLPASSPENSDTEKTARNESKEETVSISTGKATVSFRKYNYDQILCQEEEPQETESSVWRQCIGLFSSSSINRMTKKKEQESFNKSFEAAVSCDDLEFCRDLMQKVNIYRSYENKWILHPFLIAAQNGSIKLLKLMLGDDKDYKSYKDQTAMKYDKDVESSKKAIKSGFDNIINVTDHRNSNALHLTIRYDHPECVLYLIKKGIDINIMDSMQNLPIHLAAAKKNMTKVVQTLLEKGNDLAIKNKKNMTPIHLAAINGHLDILKILLRNIPDKVTFLEMKDDNNRYPLHYASANGHYQCCDELLKFDSSNKNSLDNDGCTPIILAAEKLHYLCCKSLRVFNVDMAITDPKLNTALHLAAKGGCIKTIQVLIKKNCDEIKLLEANNMNKETPIHLAATQPHSECLKVLLESLAKYRSESFHCVNEQKQGLVHLATKNSRVDSLAFLLGDSVKNMLKINDEKKQFKLKLHSHDVHGKTPLHYACQHSSVECAKILINNEANVFSKDKKGNTPLHFAAEKGSVEMCQLFLNKTESSAVNKRNTYGETPLHFAVRSNSPNCCAFLINKGAFIHMKSRKGQSPYQLAVILGNFKVVKQLTGRNLPIEAFEDSDETVLHMVAKQGCVDICKFFLKQMKPKWIIKKNGNFNSALDEAFNAGKDEIFSLILARYSLPINDENIKKDLPLEEALILENFEMTLHSYMDIACNAHGPRKIIQKAIIESDWWFTGLSACFHVDQKCNNLLHLIKFNPAVAKQVFDKCVAVINGKNVYDFRIFEQSFYKRADISEQSVMPLKSPFDLKTGKISHDESLHLDYWNGEIASPLNRVTKYYSQSFDKDSNSEGKGYTGLIRHPLVEGYWNYKWQKYLRTVFLLILLFEIFMIVVLSLYITHIWNWNQVEKILKNVSTFNCSEEQVREYGLTVRYLPFLQTFRCILAGMTVAVFVSEIYLATKVHWRSLISVGVILRIIRFLGITVLIIPFTFCYSHEWIAMN